MLIAESLSALGADENVAVPGVGDSRSLYVVVTVVTSVWFSAAFTSAVLSPPSESMTSAVSFSLVTVTVIVWTSVLVPSVAVTSTI